MPLNEVSNPQSFDILGRFCNGNTGMVALVFWLPNLSFPLESAFEIRSDSSIFFELNL